MLPANFMPEATYSLVRLGNDHEGGYMVETQSMWRSAQLVSLGVGENWSFEKDFLRRKPVPLAAYDPLLTDAYLLERTFISFLHMLILRKSPFAVLKGLWSLHDYRKFFQGSVVHHRLKAGYDGSASRSLRSIIKDADPNYPIFLKVALEGWEYHILDDVIRHADKICGLMIEFQYVHRRRRRIEEFIDTCPLTLVHIHGNNSFGLIDTNGDPVILEMTFANDPRQVADGPLIPYPADQRVDPNCKEVELRFSPY